MAEAGGRRHSDVNDFRQYLLDLGSKERHPRFIMLYTGCEPNEIR